MIRDIMQNNKLSLKAKGLYCLLYSHIATNGEIIKREDIRQYLKEGRDSLESAIKELKDNGYLMIVRNHTGNRKGVYYSYILKGLNDEESKIVRIKNKKE